MVTYENTEDGTMQISCILDFYYTIGCTRIESKFIKYILLNMIAAAAKGVSRMMARGKKGSGRQTPKVASEPLRDGGPDEAASFLAEAVADLSKLARRHGMETLGFLLDMAQMEAEEIVRLRERRRSEKS